MSTALAEQGALFGERRFTEKKAAPTVELRAYQLAAVKAIREQLAEVRSTLIVLATGTGKTTVFADVVRTFPGRRLILAHREELITQGANRIRKQTGEAVVVDKAEQVAGHDAPIVFASVQTLSQSRTEPVYEEGNPEPTGTRIVCPRMERFGRKAFDLIVVDEAHHAPSPSYRAILDYFKDAKVLGVTATPDRSDSQAMGKVFDSVAYTYDMRTAIDDGYLCEVRASQVFCEHLDLSNVKTTAGDLNQGELDDIMSTESVLHEVVKPTMELAGGRRTLIFTTTVENAHRMAEVFNRYRPECAMAIDGTATPERRRVVLGDHQAGRYQFLVNVGVLTEGYDDPLISCVAIARPTKSHALYCQMVGRGTRIAAGKDDLLVLDFCGNAGRHKLTTVTDILGGDYDDDVITEAKKKIAANPKAMVDEMLREAAAEKADRIKAEAARKRAALIAGRVKYAKRDINPFEVFGVSDPRAEFGGRFGEGPPTDPQVAVLMRAGIPLDGITKRQASRLIDTVISRRNRKLCTYAQSNTLQKKGYDTSDMLFDTASRLITAIVANGWRPLSAAQNDAILQPEPGSQG